MKNESLIHVKLEYKEAIQSKRNILSAEMNLLKNIKSIKRYKLLRREEILLKTELSKKIKSIITKIKKIQISLPKPKIPGILKKDEETREYKIKKQESSEDDSIEAQLQEIQEKLRSIGG